MLYACLLSAKSLLDLFLAEPSSSYFGFSIANLAQLGHACSTLFKLSLVEEIGWDIVYVRQTANIAAYLEQLALRFEQAGTAIDHAQRSPSKESFPTGLGRAMRRMKEFYEAKIGTWFWKRLSEALNGSPTDPRYYSSGSRIRRSSEAAELFGGR